MIPDALAARLARLRAWSGRWRGAALLAALGLAASFAASVRVDVSGRWYGLYLLESGSGRPFELKDDLKLGDGPRLISGISFSPARDILAPEDVRYPGLDLDWDEEEGGGIVTNHLGPGVELKTMFGRYVDDDGRHPHGLYVGGAVPDVAASTLQNQSGMALHDARGWHHVWCNVNEVLLVTQLGRHVTPGEWKFVGSRVLVDAPDRVVIESDHELSERGVDLRMERYAYFKAGRPYFRLGINVVNVGDAPVTVSYGYGDEPWVGEFGSAEGNLGWTQRGIIPMVSWVDTKAEEVAGIVDSKSGVANFIAWPRSGPALPDDLYFGNHSGTPKAEEMGQPLTSNEIFIGLEWRARTIDPGDTLSLRLTIGLADRRPDGSPTVPPHVIKEP